MKGFDTYDPPEKAVVPKEAHRERKHHEQEERQARAEEREEERRILAKSRHSTGFQGRCVLNLEGADPAKLRR